MLPGDATIMLADADWMVRREAVLRAPLATLDALADDPEEEVRDAVHQRITGLDKSEESS
jgi:hypothetical protein